jgi:hypothetical protein
MEKFLLWLFSILFGYNQDQVTLESGDIVFICPGAKCSKCGEYIPRRSKTSDDINIGIVRHKEFEEAIPMNDCEPANKIFAILLGVWQNVLPPEFRERYTTKKEFNRFLRQCVLDLTTPPDEKVYDIPSDIPETDISSLDGVNVSLRETYNFTEVFKLFVEALTADENKAALCKLGMPDDIL